MWQKNYDQLVFQEKKFHNSFYMLLLPQFFEYMNNLVRSCRVQSYYFMVAGSLLCKKWAVVGSSTCSALNFDFRNVCFSISIAVTIQNYLVRIRILHVEISWFHSTMPWNFNSVLLKILSNFFIIGNTKMLCIIECK